MLWRNRARMKAVGFHPKRRGASGHGTLFILFLILLLNSALGNILKDERNRSLVPLLRLSSACQAELNAQRECKTIERDARRRIGGSESNVKTRKGRMSRGEAPLRSLGGVSLKRRLAHPHPDVDDCKQFGGECYTFFSLNWVCLYGHFGNKRRPSNDSRFDETTFLVSDFWKEQQKRSNFWSWTRETRQTIWNYFPITQTATKRTTTRNKWGGGGPNDDRLQVERTGPVFLFHTQKETQPPNFASTTLIKR